MKTKLEKIYDTISPAIDRKIEEVIAKYSVEDTVQERIAKIAPTMPPNLSLQNNNIHRAAMAAQQLEWELRGYRHPQQAMSQEDIRRMNAGHQQGAIGMAGGLFGSFI